jgi:transposase
METFVGLDVSLRETSVCILDKDGTLIFEGKAASEPAPIARLIRKRAPGVVRVGLESGPTSVWLTHALTAEGLPVVCLDAGMHRRYCRCGPTNPTAAMRMGWLK